MKVRPPTGPASPGNYKSFWSDQIRQRAAEQAQRWRTEMAERARTRRVEFQRQNAAKSTALQQRALSARLRGNVMRLPPTVMRTRGK